LKPSPVKVIGPETRAIKENSPLIRVVISPASPDPRSQFRVAVKMTLYNLTDHDLSYSDVDGAYDVRISGSGKRAVETPFGCSIDFFSECHTGKVPQPWSPALLHIPSHGMLELGISYLDPEYVLEPGTYSVMGYFCTKQGGTRECIESNRITIDVSSP
jgi:hypothetical protein